MTRSIITFLSCTSLWLAFSSSGLAQEQSIAPYLPTGLQPYQSLASMDAAGKVTMKVPVANWQAKSIEDPTTKKVQTHYVAVTTYVDRHHLITQVQAYDFRGNPISAKRLRNLLQETVPVLVSADGKPVDPLHLRLYKEDVVVLVAPIWMQQPPQIYEAPIAPTQTTAPAKWDEYHPPVSKVKAGPAALTMTLTGPVKGAIQIDTPFLITITNTGTKTAKMRVRVELPEHLSIVQAGERDLTKERVVETEIRDLAPAATRVLDFTVRALQKGDFVIRATAIGEPNLNISAEHRSTYTDAPAPAIEKKQGK